jgi:hypothetical protein
MAGGFTESPCLIRRFMEHDFVQNPLSIFASSLRPIDKSDFKNFSVQNNNWQSIRDLIPTNLINDHY